MILGSVSGRPLDISSGLSQFHGHSSWLMYEVAFDIDKHKLAGVQSASLKPPNPKVFSNLPLVKFDTLQL